MDAATGARMAEAEPQPTAVGEGSDGHAAGDMLTGPCSMDIDDKESSARGAQQGSEPEQNASRTEWVRVISRSCAGSFEDERAGQDEEVGVATDVSYTLDTLPDPEALSVLEDTAVAMFVVGSEASVVFGTLKQLASSQSVRIWKLVKQAIHNVYESKQHRGAASREGGRPTSQALTGVPASDNVRGWRGSIPLGVLPSGSSSSASSSEMVCALPSNSRSLASH